MKSSPAPVHDVGKTEKVIQSVGPCAKKAKEKEREREGKKRKLIVRKLPLLCYYEWAENNSQCWKLWSLQL